MQGEAAQYVDPSEIPAAADVARLGQALAHGRRGACTSLWPRRGLHRAAAGELSPDRRQIDPAARASDVAAGRGRRETAPSPAARPQAPQTIYPAPHPRPTRWHWPIAARIQAARAEQDAAPTRWG